MTEAKTEQIVKKWKEYTAMQQIEVGREQPDEAQGRQKMAAAARRQQRVGTQLEAVVLEIDDAAFRGQMDRQEARRQIDLVFDAMEALSCDFGLGRLPQYQPREKTCRIRQKWNRSEEQAEYDLLEVQMARIRKRLDEQRLKLGDFQARQKSLEEDKKKIPLFAVGKKKAMEQAVEQVQAQAKNALDAMAADKKELHRLQRRMDALRDQLTL